MQTAQNNWSGSGLSGLSDQSFDRLYVAYTNELDGSKRDAQYAALLKYAAENALYEWLDQDAAAAAPEGLAFYDRLLKKTDPDLERGGLPRAEIEEGRNNLLNRAP